MVKYNLALVKNQQKYWEFIRELRNDWRVREGFIQQEEIGIVKHIQYMNKYSDNFYICLANGTQAGYVGIIDDDIRVATHPDFQGCGVATFMINEIMKLHPTAFAKVKLENDASLRLFEKCGFKAKYFILEKDSEA
jgi:GNAT superfamily N-acetyltransferase